MNHRHQRALSPGALALWAGLAVAAAGVPAAAEPQEPAGSSFKRVKVGERPAGSRRITVQIDAEEQARILAANPAVPPPPEVPFDAAPPSAPGGEAAAAAELDWYWEIVSPGRGAAGSGRLAPAVAALGRGPAPVPAPRLAALQDIADAHGRHMLAATAGTGVSPALVLAVIAVESAGRVRAVSHAGAAGLMQLMPATAARFGVADRMVPAANIRGGVAYLDWLLARFDGDVVLALAAYNAGEGAVDAHRGVPPFAETRDYVPKVLAAWTLARGLCLTPPQAVSDGCVFRSGARLARGE